MLRLHMVQHRPNLHLPGRKALHKIPDVMDLGAHLVFNLGGTTENHEEKVDQQVEEEDLGAELYDW